MTVRYPIICGLNSLPASPLAPYLTFSTPSFPFKLQLHTDLVFMKFYRAIDYLIKSPDMPTYIYLFAHSGDDNFIKNVVGEGKHPYIRLEGENHVLLFVYNSDRSSHSPNFNIHSRRGMSGGRVRIPLQSDEIPLADKARGQTCALSYVHVVDEFCKNRVSGDELNADEFFTAARKNFPLMSFGRNAVNNIVSEFTSILWS